MASENKREAVTDQSATRCGDELSRRRAAIGARLVEFQTQNRVIELRLEQLDAELRGMEGLSVAGLVLGLLGQRGTRLEAARELRTQLNRQQQECAATLATLEREAAELRQQADAAVVTVEKPPLWPSATVSTKNEAAPEQTANSSCPTCKASAEIERIERVMAAGQEAMKDLNDEQETMSMAGRVRLVQANRALQAVMGLARGRTADACAERVRRSVARFQRMLGCVLEGSNVDAELLSVDQDLRRAAAEFCRSWLRSTATAGASADWLQERLQTADMLLERMLREAHAAGGGRNELRQPSEGSGEEQSGGAD